MLGGFTGPTVFYNGVSETETHPVVVPGVHDDGRTE